MRAAGIDERLAALDRLEGDGRPRSALEAACVERQRADLLKGHERGLVWREDAAANVCEKLFPSLRLWKGHGAGKRFVPEPWMEQCLLAPLFGWWKENGDGLRRRFRIAYTEVPRKNAKTTIAAGVAIQGVLADGEGGAKVFSAATQKEQASLVFDDAKNMLRQSPALLKAVELNAHTIVCPRWNSTFKAVASADGPLHGLDVHRAIIDELHAHKTRAVWDVIQTGTPARRNPMLFAITTAGWDRSTICWEQHEYSRQILEGHIADDSYFAFLAAADPDDDPFDPQTWRKANPNLGVSVQYDYLEQESARARQSAPYENTFRQLHLDQWTEQAVRWLPMHLWDASGGEVRVADLEGRECYAGLDLSLTRDLSALTLVFRLGDRTAWLPFFWTPQEFSSDRDERDRRVVTNYAEQGHVKRTPGNTQDHKQIIRDIAALRQRFRIKKIGYDPNKCHVVAQELQDEHGFVMEKCPQNGRFYNEPCDQLDAHLLKGTLEHFGNPVLRWNASNVCLRVFPDGNKMPDRREAGNKIDGIAAGLMGERMAMDDESDSTSVYDREGRGFVTLG